MIKSVIEQHWLERTHWPRRIILAIALGFALALAFKAPAQDRVPPRLSVGVMQCDEVVAIWVVTQDGNVRRTDAEHHPDSAADYQAFLQWLTKGEQDIYVIPCKDTAAGGKTKKKAQS